MNASDIKDFVFNKSAVGGYKVSDVRGCLKEISEYVLSLEEKNYNLDRENKSLKSKLSEVEKSQDEIKDIMISAQDFKRKILQEAEDKTNELVLQAKEKAKKIEMEAEQSSTEKIEKLSKKYDAKVAQLNMLKKEVSSFKMKLLEIYRAHLDLITKLPEINENSNINNNNNNDENNSNETNNIDNIKTDDDESEFYEDESEIFEKMQTNKKPDLTENSSNINSFKKNLSEDENIFQKKLVKNSDQSHSNSLKNADGYLKSRFDELNM